MMARLMNYIGSTVPTFMLIPLPDELTDFLVLDVAFEISNRYIRYYGFAFAQCQRFFDAFQETETTD